MTCPTCGHPQLTERPHVHVSPPDGVTREMVREAIRQVGHDMESKTHPPTSPPHLVDDGYLVEPDWDEADGMCPNCVTPWKCNGPHLADQTPYKLASAWRSCLVRAGLLALALILVGLVAAQLARAT